MILDRNSDFLIFKPKLWILNQKCDFLKRICHFRKTLLTTKLRFFWFLTENSFFDEMTLFDFMKKKTYRQQIQHPLNLLKNRTCSIFCVGWNFQFFAFSWFCDFVFFNFYQSCILSKNICKNWFQGQMMSIGVKFCHVLRSMDESSNPFIIQVMFMVSAYPSSERFVLDDLIPVFLFLVFQNWPVFDPAW